MSKRIAAVDEDADVSGVVSGEARAGSAEDCVDADGAGCAAASHDTAPSNESVHFNALKMHTGRVSMGRLATGEGAHTPSR
jgi:hypothetical protein